MGAIDRTGGYAHLAARIEESVLGTLVPHRIGVRGAILLLGAVEVAATGGFIRDELVLVGLTGLAADIRGQRMGIAVHQSLGHTLARAGLIIGFRACLVLQDALLTDVIHIAALQIVEVYAVLNNAAVLEGAGGAIRFVLAGAHLGGGIEVRLLRTGAVQGRLLVRTVIVAVAGLRVGHELLGPFRAGYRAAGRGSGQ